MKLLRTMICCGTIASTITAAQGDLLIAEGGASEYAIVVPDAPTPEETHAAEELAHYLQAATGAELPIVAIADAPDAGRMLVGAAALPLAPDSAELAGDAFIVRAVGDDLVLAGAPPRGTLYAVFDFLEREVGCRWFNWYGEEHVPDLARLTVGEIDRREEPAFATRDVYFHRNSDPTVARNFVLRSRISGPATANLLGEEGYGGTRHINGGPGVHTLFHYISPEQHLDEHPEWFSLVSGRRQARQLCFTNPELRQAMTEAVRAQAATMQGVRNISISAQDTGGEFCECEACRAVVEREGCPGGPLYDYILEVADALAEDYPDVFVTTLAYRHSQSEEPPAGLHMPGNVIIIFAPIDANFAAALEHPSNAETLANITRWPERCEHLWVWYYTNPYGSATGLPIGNLGRLADDMRLFRHIGVEGFFIEHDTGIAQMHLLADLQTWLLAKLMWEPERDLQALIADFTDHYYGPAAPMIRDYIDLLERETAARQIGMRWSASPGQFKHLTPEFVARCDTLLDAAEEAVAQDDVLRQRVRIARMSVDRARLMLLGLAPETITAAPAEVVERYRTTWERAVQERIAENRRAAVAAFVDAFLALAEAFREPAPLPAPLADVDPDRVVQVGPMVVQARRETRLVPDERAAMGIAVTRPTEGEAPFTMGAYAFDTATHIVRAEITPEQISSADYSLYRLGEGALTPASSIWATRSWGLTVPLESAFDAAEPERVFTIYASMRFEGPAYNQPGEEDRVFIDRIVLVRAQ